MSDLLFLYLFGAVASACYLWITDGVVRRPVGFGGSKDVSPWYALDPPELVFVAIHALAWPVRLLWKAFTPFWVYPHG